jgi:hypothetical protein
MGSAYGKLVQWSNANGGDRRYSNGVKFFGQGTGTPQDDISVIGEKLLALNQPAGATTAAASDICNVLTPGSSTCTTTGGRTDAVVQSIMTKSPAEQSQVFSFTGNSNEQLGLIQVTTVAPLRPDWVAGTSSMLNALLEVLNPDGSVLASSDEPVDGKGAGQGASIGTFPTLAHTVWYTLHPDNFHRRG